jgi:hypothetical protein
MEAERVHAMSGGETIFGKCSLEKTSLPKFITLAFSCISKKLMICIGEITN